MPAIDTEEEAPGVAAILAGTAISRREQAKNGRRRRIIDAACSLLREFGLEAVSGKSIAARAVVSLSTVYNLFGSKDAVLVAVYDEDLAHFEAAIRDLSSSDPVTHLFDSVDVAAALYDRDAPFYRAILWRGPPGNALDSALRRPRARFWEKLVQQAVEAGQLRRGTDAGAVSMLLILVFSGALADLVAGDIAVAQFRDEVCFGFAAVLLAFVEADGRTALEARMMHFHDGIRTLQAGNIGVKVA